MEIKHLHFILLLLCFSSLSQAQSTLHFTADDFHYREGLALLNENKYGAARLAFDKYLESGADGEKLALTQYYIAYCGIQLDHSDAEKLVESFILNNPNHPKAEIAYFELGNLKYNRKRYEEAIKYYERLYFPYLPKDIEAEARFKLGYSYFTLKKFDEAYGQFNELKRKNNEFQYASSYYSGYINFQKEEYDRAYYDFIKAGENDYYAEIVPELINKTLYKQKRYDEVIRYSHEALQKRNVKNTSEFYLFLAEAYYKKNDYENSSKYFREYLDRTKGAASPDIMFRIADARQRAGDIDGAIEGFKEAALENNEMGQIASFYLGHLYVKSDRKNLALAAYKSAMDATYDKTIQEDAHFNYAKVAYDLGHYGEAITAMNTYLSKYPQSPKTNEVNELITDSYFRTNNYEAAIRHFESLRVKSDRVKKAYQMITFNEGARLFNTGEYYKAIDLFDKSAEFGIDLPTLLKAHCWKGDAFYLVSQYDDAKNSYSAVFRHDSGGQSEEYLKARYGIGYVYFNEKDYEKALPHFRYFVDRGRSHTNYHDALVRLADCYYTTKQYDQAIATYSQVQSGTGQNQDYAAYQKGLIYGLQSRLSQADASFDLVINNHPRSMYRDDALFQKAQFNFENGNYRPAIQGFSQLIGSYPNSPFIPYAYQSRALAHANLGDRQASANDYKHIITHYPTHKVGESALLGLQQELSALGQADQFSRHLDSYKAANPDKSNFESVEFESAKTLYFDQKYEQAARAFQKFLAAYPSSSSKNEALYYQGDAYFRGGNYPQARASFEQLRGETSYTRYDRVIERLAEIEFNAGRYPEAIGYFRKYEGIAGNKKGQYRAWSAMMEGYYALEKYDSVDHFAQNILNNALVTTEAEGKAQLYLGKSAYKRNKFGAATDYFLNTLNTAKDENGAEAQYLLATIYHQQAKYQNSLETLFDLNKNFSAYDYWLGRSFLLIADNYLAMKETFQAKATLESILAHAENQEILKEARQKLAQIETSKPDSSNAPDTLEILNPETR